MLESLIQERKRSADAAKKLAREREILMTSNEWMRAIERAEVAFNERRRAAFNQRCRNKSKESDDDEKDLDDNFSHIDDNFSDIQGDDTEAIHRTFPSSSLSSSSVQVTQRKISSDAVIRMASEREQERKRFADAAIRITSEHEIGKEMKHKEIVFILILFYIINIIAKILIILFHVFLNTDKIKFL